VFGPGSGWGRVLFETSFKQVLDRRAKVWYTLCMIKHNAIPASNVLLTHWNTYGDQLQTDKINVTGLRTAFSLTTINIIPEGHEGRQEHCGPMVPGPWAFCTAHALVIDNHGGTARERAEAVQIAAGEPIQVEGLPGVWTFADRDQRRLEGDGVKLVPYEYDEEQRAAFGRHADPAKVQVAS
jgi:hypothetical protein